MSQTPLNYGAFANDPAADDIRTTFSKITQNFTDLFPLWRAIAVDQAGQNVNTAQPWFSALGAVSVAAATAYLFDGLLMFVRSAGTTSHTIGLSFGGSATLTSINYLVHASNANEGALGTTSALRGDAAGNLTVTAANTSATEAFSAVVRGIVRVDAAGTVIPQFQFSAAPGGVPTIKANTYFRLVKLGAGSAGTDGGWS